MLNTNLLTQIAIVNDTTGKKRIAFSYDVVDETGETAKSNQRKSFLVMDSETQELVDKLEEKVLSIMNSNS
ncbi:hypothetical protein [Clostridium sp. C2-6-12]|uniref:hypothetical protein n=1 Tax=Clostridium sp. C2-6-12 TaxID=2698832 RepID=UPI00136F695D|nr:hypothetical protein [Clostridium sp. C2-6-12]